MRIAKLLFLLFALGISIPAYATVPEAAAPLTLEVSSANHYGVWRGDTVEWHSQYDSRMVSYASEGSVRIALASPLSDGAVVESTDDTLELEPERDENGRIVAVTYRGDRRSTYELRTVVQVEAGMDPPLAHNAPQRIELEGARVRPGGDSPLELRLTDIRHRDVAEATADRLEDRWGDARGTARPVVVFPDREYLDSGGLSAHVQSSDEPAGHNVFVLSGLMIVVLVGLGIVLKLVWRAAQAEEAEAFLRDFNVESLDT